MGSSGIRRPVVEYIDIDRVEEVSCRRLQVLRCWWCCDVLDVSQRAASRSFNFGQEFLFFHQGKRIRTKDSDSRRRISGRIYSILHHRQNEARWAAVRL